MILPRPACILAALAAALLAAGEGCARQAPPPQAVIRTEPVRPPLDVEARRALVGREIGRFVCPASPDPVRDLFTEGFYTDADSSRLSAEAYARYQEAVRPLASFEARLTALGDAFVRSRPAHIEVARCALAWLEAWAGEGALLGRVSQQGGYDRKWALSAIAATYVKIQGAPGLNGAARRRVEWWIGQLAAAVRSHHETRSGSDTRNNHAYWAAAGLVWAGAGLNDRALFGWGVERYRAAAAQIRADGTLPLELARKSKARHFHLFALTPLILIAEAGARNDLDLYGERGGAIHRLVGRVVESLDDPGDFERLTGAKQDWVGGLDGGSLVWMEPYFARFRDPRLAPWLARFRPMRHPWYGGDATLGFGSATL